MDPVLIVYGIITAIAGGLFWRKVDDVDKRLADLGTTIKENKDSLDEDIKKSNEHLGELTNEMGRHDERGKYLKEHLDAIFKLLREIDAKLDKKADKT